MSSPFALRLHTVPMPAGRLPLVSLLAAAVLMALLLVWGGPATAAGKKPVKSVAKKAAVSKHKPVKAVKSHKALKPLKSISQRALVVAAEPEIDLSPAQVAAAGHVLVGQVSCEFGQTLQLAAVADRPGQFQLTLGKASYRLIPQETATGAVRLEDQKDGIVWLQIPSKSMLLSARLGQRLVDNCMHDAQRAYVVSSDNALGIAEAPAVPVAVLAHEGPPLPLVMPLPLPPSAPVPTIDALVAASPLQAGAGAGACIDPHFQDALTVALTGADMQEPAPWLDCCSARGSMCTPAQGLAAR